MSIYIGSRYETAATDFVPTSNGGSQLTAFRGPSPLPDPTFYTYYLVREGDRLDRLSYRFYQRDDYWWVIADANPEQPLPDPLIPGTLLRIPDARNVG